MDNKARRDFRDHIPFRVSHEMGNVKKVNDLKDLNVIHKEMVEIEEAANKIQTKNIEKAAKRTRTEKTIDDEVGRNCNDHELQEMENLKQVKDLNILIKKEIDEIDEIDETTEKTEKMVKKPHFMYFYNMEHLEQYKKLIEKLSYFKPRMFKHKNQVSTTSSERQK